MQNRPIALDGLVWHFPRQESLQLWPSGRSGPPPRPALLGDPHDISPLIPLPHQLFSRLPQPNSSSYNRNMAKHIDNANEDEPAPIPFKTGGKLARQYEYLVFYFFTICSWALEIAAACLGSLYGGQSHVFIATVAPFLATYWSAVHTNLDVTY